MNTCVEQCSILKLRYSSFLAGRGKLRDTGVDVNDCGLTL